MVTITFQIEEKEDKVAIACAADLRLGTDGERDTANRICLTIFDANQAIGTETGGVHTTNQAGLREKLEAELKSHGMSFENSPIAKALGETQPNPN